ncbi:hypothetical protein CYMTET_5921 [Cymbomonas tetramitiformis]|uniref:Serine hydrolase domain-containing protein n=1 Tax=Cymbomonas tetramitiformis TaxID=36881 RepID=A0AAE0H049_9CHLO|nr:hypothetical protein CYMTET_5921 [Cymbomonas tetramitiformis]
MQNAEVFRLRTGALRRALRTRCDFTFVDAPHAVSIQPEEGPKNMEPMFGWWTASDKAKEVNNQHKTEYIGFEESLELVNRLVREDGPYDGVLGFSQGAAMAAMLLRTSPHPFKFGIIVSGFIPRDPTLAHALSSGHTCCPTLHICGSSDQRVPMEGSKALLEVFEENGELFEHSSGHCIPTGSETKQVLRAFIDRVSFNTNT